MHRRHFVPFAAAATAASTAALAAAAPKQRRAPKVEIVFRSPDPQPNGLQATPEGLWIIDQGLGSRVSLVDFQGKLIRQFATETERSSGITHDGGSLWIASTYSRETVRCDAQTGKTISRHPTPGAGVIYKMKGDAPARSSPVPKEQRQPAPSQTWPDPPACASGSRALGTGAHGQEWRDGKLWSAVPPSRQIYCIDPVTWTVERMFPAAGNRVHGIGWEGNYLWVADSNLNGFVKHDPTTGAILEKLTLSDRDPLPHGMTIWQGWLWYCDDIGLVCRFRL